MPPKIAIDPATSKLDASKLDAIFGQKGEYKDGVYKATFGRTAKMGGHRGRQRDGREHLGGVRGH